MNYVSLIVGNWDFGRSKFLGIFFLFRILKLGKQNNIFLFCSILWKGTLKLSRSQACVIIALLTQALYISHVVKIRSKATY